MNHLFPVLGPYYHWSTWREVSGAARSDPVLEWGNPDRAGFSTQIAGVCHRQQDHDVCREHTWRRFGMNSAGLMQELAGDTGGTFEDPTTSSSRSVNFQELPDILKHMGAVIRNQQEVTFETAKADGKTHSMNVRALDTTLVLHGPRYFVAAKP